MFIVGRRLSGNEKRSINYLKYIDSNGVIQMFCCFIHSCGAFSNLPVLVFGVCTCQIGGKNNPTPMIILKKSFFIEDIAMCPKLSGRF